MPNRIAIDAAHVDALAYHAATDGRAGESASYRQTFQTPPAVGPRIERLKLLKKCTIPSPTERDPGTLVEIGRGLSQRHSRRSRISPEELQE